jgi:hypothetical protein
VKERKRAYALVEENGEIEEVGENGECGLLIFSHKKQAEALRFDGQNIKKYYLVPAEKKRHKNPTEENDG